MIAAIILPLLVTSAVVQTTTVGTSDSFEMSAVVTDMSVVGPEAHVLIRNRTDKHMGFALFPSGSCVQETTADRRKKRELREHPWMGVREVMMTTGQSVPPHGLAHRVFAARENVLPCDLEVELVSDQERIQISLTLDRKPLASPHRSSTPPAARLAGWAEYDFDGSSLLLHVLVESDEAFPFNVGIMEREILCFEGGKATWEAFMDVPQGLSTGPMRIDPGGWGAFVLVARSPSAKQSELCVAEFRVGYEQIPMVFRELGTLRFPIRASGSIQWNFP